MNKKKDFVCRCINVEIGSYDNQIWVHAPSHMPKENGYCLDTCIAEEVMQLWMKGIETTGCCCGHGKAHPFIGVAEKDIQKMRTLGYQGQYNPMRPGDEDTFYPLGYYSNTVLPPRPTLDYEQEFSAALQRQMEDMVQLNPNVIMSMGNGFRLFRDKILPRLMEENQIQFAEWVLSYLYKWGHISRDELDFRTSRTMPQLYQLFISSLKATS